MAALDEGVVQSVINSNFKGHADLQTLVTGLAAVNAQSHNKFVDAIREFALGEMVMQRAGIDVEEAISVKKVAEADLSRAVSELGTAIAALQQIIKTAQTTIPVTP